MQDSRIRVFSGHFGSGKTEFSINYAIKLAKENKKTCIVDLDTVNPYFSVREVKDYLESLNIRVVSPHIKITTAELSTVPSEVMAVFDDRSYEVVIDVGGDEAGAQVLGQYNRYFKQEPYDMYFVINTNRPLTDNPQKIIDYIDSIEKSARLETKYLINNTNMSYDTAIKDILKGQEIIKEVSLKSNKPIKYTAVREDLINDLPRGIEGEVFKLSIFMQPEWLVQDN
ncbi:hypothetical protein OXPF_00480 [Oxobacter pfennigii]|uniref:CobQ/CobB/MinD/ParA nucleotide binding domain-containing protein n=1 Tax=Oxobacter pfennigii TaxID=36849 RepID=A0A0N8NU09_9CLOT|nr:hypothetical protein [Oxobacter pfennigii]KPU46320.1 hypothetical protein OXPF_00480 [Oxobacter pfennigii]